MNSKSITCFFCAHEIENSAQQNYSNKFKVTNQQLNCLNVMLTYLTSGGGDQSFSYFSSSKLNKILKLWTSNSYLVESTGNIYITQLCVNCNDKVEKFVEMYLEFEYIRSKLTNNVKNMQSIILHSKLKSSISTDQESDILIEFQEAVCSSVNTRNLKANMMEDFTTQQESQPFNIDNELDDVISIANSPEIIIADDSQDNIDYNSLLDEDDEATSDFIESPITVNKVIPVQNYKSGNKQIIKRRYCCGQCQDEKGNHKTFETESDLRQHIEEQHRKISFKCKVCGVTFAKNYNLNAHKRIHRGDAFKCKECGKEFAHKSVRDSHEKYAHTEERKMECKVCGKRFRTPHGLSEHMQSHEDRIFDCHICKRKFKTKKVLKNHLRAHSGERKFECDICGLKLTTKRAMQKHQKKMHPELK